MRPILLAMESTIQITPIYGIVIIHETVERNYQHRFSVNVWCGVIADQIICPYIFPQRLSDEIYANVLQDDLPALLEIVPLKTRRQMCYQHDGVRLSVSESKIPKPMDWS